MVCSTCGMRNTRNAKYCGKCGHKFPRFDRSKQFGNAGNQRPTHKPEREETITFDFGAANNGLNPDGSISFGEPPRREKKSRLRESYISLLEKSVPENFGVFKSHESSETESKDNWVDVSAPPSTPWALEQEFQITKAREYDCYSGWSATNPAASNEETDEADIEERKLIGWLVTFSHKPEGEDFRLQSGRTLIGSSPRCDIVIEDDSLGSVQASIIYEDGQCFINNELLYKEIFVNDRSIKEPYALESYDEIRLGQTVLKFISVNPISHADQETQAAD